MRPYFFIFSISLQLHKKVVQHTQVHNKVVGRPEGNWRTLPASQPIMKRKLNYETKNQVNPYRIKDKFSILTKYCTVQYGEQGVVIRAQRTELLKFDQSDQVFAV